MRCGECYKADRHRHVSKLSKPSRCMCTITGEFHDYNDECDCSNYILVKPIETNIGTACLVCGESVILTKNELMAIEHRHDIYKICDKCKAAILHIREQMETQNEN